MIQTVSSISHWCFSDWHVAKSKSMCLAYKHKYTNHTPSASKKPCRATPNSDLQRRNSQDSWLYIAGRVLDITPSKRPSALVGTPTPIKENCGRTAGPGVIVQQLIYTICMAKYPKYTQTFWLLKHFTVKKKDHMTGQTKLTSRNSFGDTADWVYG